MKTLINTKKHSASIAKLVAMVLLKDNGVECYFNTSLEALNMRASRSSVLDAFKKDISKTASDLFNAQAIINNIQNGKVVEFDSIYNTIEDVFSSTYDANNKTITLSGVVFDTEGGNTMSKQEIEAEMLKNLFNIDKKELNGVLKSLSKYEEAKSDIDKAILYPSTVLADKILKKISDEDVKFGKYRAKMSYEDQLEFDVTFKRTGIDGVIQNATYVDASGIKQLATSHKRRDSVELERLLKSNLKYINAVEVDGDGDLQKVSHLMKQIEKLTLNTEVKFTFKARKLGNYKARGLCMPSQRIVAEDVRDTSAIIHEIAHHIHLLTLEEDKFVNYMISKLTPLIELDSETPESKIAYYNKPTEVVARACEIASLFAQEEGRLAIDDKDFEIIKSRGFYTSNKGIYFNFTAFDEDTKQEMLQLFRLFYETSPKNYREGDFDNFIKIDTRYKKIEKELSFYELMRKEQRKAKKELKALYSLVTHSNIDKIFANRKSAPLLELAKKILANISYIGNHKSRMTAPEWREVIEDKAGVIGFVFDEIKINSSEKEWIKFLVEFNKYSWKEIRKEILFSGFSINFARSLRKEFAENETPNHDAFKKFASEVLNRKIGLLISQDLYTDEVFLRELIGLDQSVIVDFDGSQIKTEVLVRLTKEIIADEDDSFRWWLLNEGLRDNREFMQWAVEKSKNARVYVNGALKDDKEFMLFVCELHGYTSLSNIGGELADDVEFAKEIQKEHSDCLVYFSKKVNNALKEKDEVKAKKPKVKKAPTPKKSKSSKIEKEPEVKANDDFDALVDSGEIIEFERTDGKGVEKVLKLEDKISDFKSFNQYMKQNKIGYYSRIAKGFILYKEYVEKALSDNKNVAAATATALYGADALQNFANGTLF